MSDLKLGQSRQVKTALDALLAMKDSPGNTIKSFAFSLSQILLHLSGNCKRGKGATAAFRPSEENCLTFRFSPDLSDGVQRKEEGARPKAR